MSKANVDKGKRYELAAAKHATARMAAAGLDIEVRRRASLGLPEDQGDLFGIPDTAVQCKDTTKIDLTVVDQAEQQAARQGATYGVLLQKRRQQAIGRSYVVMTYDTYLDLMIDRERERQT